MALNKKVYGVRMAISAPILAVHGILLFIPKAENLLRRNQKLATSEDFS